MVLRTVQARIFIQEAAVPLAHLCVPAISPANDLVDNRHCPSLLLSPNQSALRRVVQRTRVVLSPRLLSSLNRPPIHLVDSVVIFLNNLITFITEIWCCRGVFCIS